MTYGLEMGRPYSKAPGAHTGQRVRQHTGNVPQCYLRLTLPFPQIDTIECLEGKREDYQAVLCSIVCNNCAQCNADTYVGLQT